MGELVSNINTKNWSISTSLQGEIVKDIEDINQCIYVILKTIQGTDPMNPAFGCGLYLYQDQPINIGLPNMIREIGSSIEKYEPRATITNITYEIDLSTVIFSIYWSSSFGNSVTVLPINLQ
jgi:uncharacterized protein